MVKSVTPIRICRGCGDRWYPQLLRESILKGFHCLDLGPRLPVQLISLHDPKPSCLQSLIHIKRSVFLLGFSQDLEILLGQLDRSESNGFHVAALEGDLYSARDATRRVCPALCVARLHGRTVLFRGTTNHQGDHEQQTAYGLHIFLTSVAKNDGGNEPVVNDTPDYLRVHGFSPRFPSQLARGLLKQRLAPHAVDFVTL